MSSVAVIEQEERSLRRNHRSVLMVGPLQRPHRREQIRSPRRAPSVWCTEDPLQSARLAIDFNDRVLMSQRHNDGIIRRVFDYRIRMRPVAGAIRNPRIDLVPDAAQGVVADSKWIQDVEQRPFAKNASVPVEIDNRVTNDISRSHGFVW